MEIWQRRKQNRRNEDPVQIINVVDLNFMNLNILFLAWAIDHLDSTVHPTIRANVRQRGLCTCPEVRQIGQGQDPGRGPEHVEGKDWCLRMLVSMELSSLLHHHFGLLDFISISLSPEATKPLS